jgi:hypothetical protein
MVKEIYQFPSILTSRKRESHGEGDLPTSFYLTCRKWDGQLNSVHLTGGSKKTPFSSTLPQAVGKIYEIFNRPIRAFIYLLLQLIVILSVMF